MDVRKLEAFCRVYELRNFSKAGEAMFLSQPTISSHVAGLEEELGVKLFDRLGRSVVPTRAGEVLYPSAVMVFQNLNQAKAAIELLRDNVVGELIIGCSTIPSQAIVPGILAGFSETYPEVSYTIRTRDSAEVIRHVMDGRWSLGIVGQKPDGEDLNAIELVEDSTCVVAAVNAAWLPTQKAFSVQDVAGLPWIMRERGSATRQTLEGALARAGMRAKLLNIRCRVQGTHEALACALAGVGVCSTSLLACQGHLDRGALTRLPVPELEGPRHFYLIYHKARHVFPALKAFIDFAS